MLRKVLLLLLAFLPFYGHAQLEHPANWKFSVEKGPGNERTLVFQATLEPEWHMYSQFTPDGGPLPMEFKFEPSTCVELIGKVAESKGHEEFDSTFMVKVLIFEKSATFRQKIRLKDERCTVKGTVFYQACKEACIFLEEEFEFKLQGNAASEAPAESLPASDTAAEVAMVVDSSFTTDSTSTATTDELEAGCGIDSDHGQTGTGQGLWGIFLAGLLGGFLALLTPCVFPMVPMTVSFFTKRSGSRSTGIRNAIIYALSIIGIYVSLGLLVTVLFGSDALNDLASNVFFNMAFFVIFVIFAISFFGAFEITLPSGLVNKADAASDRGGLLGIFFMAFTLSLVSFSCTGPIIGTLLVEAAHGRSYMGPLTGMLGFSMALAIPFALFSLFPGWLNSLPKSGGWLNTVKVSLGFIELALAMKFLSNVDLAYHWGILQRELFIVIWVVIFGLLGLYLLGKFKLSHDSDTPHIGIGRLLSAILSLSFCVYLIPGIWGAPLKMISGFPPPDFYKEWKTGDESDCPHDLLCFKDYEEGMRYAKSQGKPVMIDFTGWSCVNCRKMEDNVWSDPKVLKRLSDNYVLISLYVDDKTPLAATEQRISATTGRKIRTTGNRWSDMQASMYRTNSQPYYVLVDVEGKQLAQPRGYTPDIGTFAAFLDEGLCRFEKRKNR